MKTDIKQAVSRAETRVYDVDEIDDLLSDLESEIEDLEREIEDLENEVSDLENELTEVRGR